MKSSSFGRTKEGKGGGLRSHREVVGEAEVRAVAAKEDPPCGGCVGGGVRGKGGEDSEGRGGFLGKRGGRGEKERGWGRRGDEAFFLRGKGIGGKIARGGKEEDGEAEGRPVVLY